MSVLINTLSAESIIMSFPYGHEEIPYDLLYTRSNLIYGKNKMNRSILDIKNKYNV